MIDMIIAILESFRFFAGILIGSLLDGLLTGVVSYFAWGAFNTDLFLILFIPCALAAFYGLMKIEKGHRR